jgi:capsular polysaccharide biosynthesis protein
MELQDYAAALRRHWPTWIGLTAVAVVTALAVVLFSTPAYQATAKVFVASTAEGNSGSQFVNQRVTSYPDIAESRAVLGPVIEDLDLTEPFTNLRARVEAVNPPDTSLVRITVTDDDPVRAATVANSVAHWFSVVVEDLEEPRTGGSPVALTVTDLATVPNTPVFPQPSLLLAMGLVVGLALGVAMAIVRSRRDTRLYREADVRAAWGTDGDQLTVYAAPADRRRRQRAGGPALMFARQLEPMAEEGHVGVVAVAPSPDDRPVALAFARDVVGELAGWDVPANVDTTVRAKPATTGSTGVTLIVGTPMAPLREWRRLAREHDGVVLVVQAGRSDREDLREIRSILDAAQAQVLAVALLRKGGRKARNDGPPPRVIAPQPARRESVTAGR